MCDKLPYENPRIDDCLKALIKEINDAGQYRSIASCCGHGVYPPTIIVKDNKGNISEFFSKVPLKKPKRNRFYKKDASNYYYLNPALVNNNF